MRPETVDVLKRLAKGKNALTLAQLIAFCREVGTADEAVIQAAVARRATASRTSAPKPSWLLEMEEAKKKLSWSAPEATRKLIEIAADEGFVSPDVFAGRKTAPTFAVAAKRIAKEVGGDRLASAYSREVTRLEREFRLG